MTVPFETPIGLSNQPFYVRERKDFAVRQEIYRHRQALYSIGEYVYFVLMWNVEDYQKGLVARCQRCFGRTGDPSDLTARIGEVYKQPTTNKCPECFGTTFQGGVRAKIVRPALLSDTDDDEKPSRRGVVRGQNITVESVEDFRFRSGDYLFRVDGSRWQLSAPVKTTLRTGLEHPSQIASSIGYARGQASLEDPTSVAYLIYPSKEELAYILNPGSRFPLSNTDIVNGPLIPPAWTD